MPALVVLLIPFFATAAAIVIIGLSQTHTAQHGSSTSTGFWQSLTSGVLKTLFGAITKVGRFVVSHFAAAQLDMMAKWFIGMGTLSAGWFGVNAGFVEAIVYAVERVVHWGDPRARAKAANAKTHAVHAGRAAHKGIRIGHSNAANLHHYQTKTDARIKPLHHATTVALPREIGRVRGRVGTLEREYDDLRDRTKSLEDGAIKTWKWIRTHPLSGTTAVFTGAVAIALARMGFGFLRCRNWQKVGRRLTCGMGGTFLHLLEAVATFVLGTLSVLKPEKLAQDTVDAVDGIEFVLTKILEN